MSTIELAMPTIFLHEGRYVNNRKDPGGATNYGVSLRFLKKVGDLDKDGWLDGDIDHDGDIDADDIKEMKENDAVKIYKLYWWDKYGYSQVDEQAIATKLISISINIDHIGAHKCLQRACRAAGGYVLLEDGILGPKTFNAINNCDPIKLLPAFKSEAAGYYRSIRLKNGNEQEFIKGWLNRAYSDMVLL